jgi:hypothetical protein
MKPAASTRLTSSRLTSSGLFVAALLVVFSISGLMAGMVTRQITTVAVSSGVPATATLSSAAQTATAAANGTPTASGAFALKVQLVPNTARIGQTVQLTVMACTLDCGPNTLPLPGVLCTLQQTPSAPSLNGAWPSPLLTDSGGQARWPLALASQMAPGAYQISVKGDGAAYNGKAYSWSGSWTLVVTA